MSAGTVHPNPDAVDIPPAEARRLLEELRQAPGAPRPPRRPRGCVARADHVSRRRPDRVEERRVTGPCSSDAKPGCSGEVGAVSPTAPTTVERS